MISARSLNLSQISFLVGLQLIGEIRTLFSAEVRADLDKNSPVFSFCTVNTGHNIMDSSYAAINDGSNVSKVLSMKLSQCVFAPALEFCETNHFMP